MQFTVELFGYHTVLKL